jgi:transcriptional regulator with XRE-family HTH domain
MSQQTMNAAIASRIRLVSENLALSQKDIGDLLNTTQRTVSRWTSGATSPQRLAKQRLLQLSYISEQLSQVLEPEDANLWLYTPNRLLDGATPADLIKQHEFRKVTALIDALAEGIVV